MGFFGAVFAALTMFWQYHVGGLALGIPFMIFVAIGLAATYVLRLPGVGIVPSKQAERVIMWSSAAEGVGLFLAANLVINIHRPDLLLPAMALIVGLHFLPIAFSTSFRPYYVLGAALILAAIVGMVVRAPTGGKVAGLVAAFGLWAAAMLALRRDWLAKRGSSAAV